LSILSLRVRFLPALAVDALFLASCSSAGRPVEYVSLGSAAAARYSSRAVWYCCSSFTKTFISPLVRQYPRPDRDRAATALPSMVHANRSLRPNRDRATSKRIPKEQIQQIQIQGHAKFCENMRKRGKYASLLLTLCEHSAENAHDLCGVGSIYAQMMAGALTRQQREEHTRNRCRWAGRRGAAAGNGTSHGTAGTVHA
jgi:hypothetical protein